DYFRDIGRMVLAAEGRKANDSHADCYQYFCVPEYGTANGRLHFHAVHFMRTTLMRPSLVLFLVLWLKLVKDFLKVRCRLALLPFLISCLIWLDLVASLPLIKERILVIILLLHFLSLML